MNRTLLIVDLEATCWPAGEHSACNMETIEIGALRVHPGETIPHDTFQIFVRPTRYPQLSDSCTHLTSIRQSDVEGAETFPLAFSRFLDWVGDPKQVLFSSWGEYDRKQFSRDCSNNKVRYPFDDHLNLKKWVATRIDREPEGMKPTMHYLKLSQEGTHHRALDDVLNIWRIANHVTDGQTDQVR